MPPAAQQSPAPAEIISYMDVYVFIGSDTDYTLRTTLGVSIRPANTSVTSSSNASSPTPAPPTAAPNTPAPFVPSPHGAILALLITACALVSLLILGCFGWLLAMRRHLKRQGEIAPPQSSAQELPNGGPVSPRWHRTSAHSLSFVPHHAAPTLIGSSRRRVRTADHEGPLTLVVNEAPPDRTISSPEKSIGSRKRASTLLQTIHTRSIRGSPKIGSSKSAAKGSPEVPTRKTFSPRLGFGQSSPRIGVRIKKDEDIPMVDPTPARDGFTNSWCSALQLDPFQSPGASVDLTRPLDSSNPGSSPAVVETPKTGTERPKSPTPKKGSLGGGDKTMSMSELRHSLATVGRAIWKADRGEEKGNSSNSTKMSLAPTDSYLDEAPTPRPALPHVLPVDLVNASSSSVNRSETYAHRTNQLGMALLTPLPGDNRPENAADGSFGLSFDSFFSPTSPAENTGVVQDYLEARYGNVSSERLVQIARSQDTLATTYVTATESGASPNMVGDEDTGAEHLQIENMGIIGSPSTLHSEMAELDDISSPLLTIPDVHVDADKTQVAEKSNQSLSVEYGRGGEQSLRVLDSFPGMLRGSLSYFPEDVEVHTPVLPSSYRVEKSYQEPSDILLLPEEDLDQGCIRLARVEIVPRVGDHSAREGSVEQAKNSQVSLHKGRENNTSGSHDVEDSLMSPDVSEQRSKEEDSILSQAKSTESVDSLQVRDVAEMRTKLTVRYRARW